ncbi:MAG: hypothetical protein RIC35_08400 [Marinoscillum sp.]
MGRVKYIALMVVVLLIGACQNESDVLEKQESVYLIHRANSNPTRGKIFVTALEPDKLELRIQLENTVAGSSHPAHLHFGSVSEVGDLAFTLNPVDGVTGESLTVLDGVNLADGRKLTYDLFLQLDGSIKIHMNDNYFKHMVLAFGNIGKNEDYLFDGVAVCTGH